MTLDAVIKAEEYPLLRIEDIFASLAGGTHFNVIDLAKVYHHIEFDESSRKYVTLNTQEGLYVYNRFIFSIKSAPVICQRAMD